MRKPKKQGEARASVQYCDDPKKDNTLLMLECMIWRPSFRGGALKLMFTWRPSDTRPNCQMFVHLETCFNGFCCSFPCLFVKLVGGNNENPGSKGSNCG